MFVVSCFGNTRNMIEQEFLFVKFFALEETALAGTTRSGLCPDDNDNADADIAIVFILASDFMIVVHFCRIRRSYWKQSQSLANNIFQLGSTIATDINLTNWNLLFLFWLKSTQSFSFKSVKDGIARLSTLQVKKRWSTSRGKHIHIIEQDWSVLVKDTLAQCNLNKHVSWIFELLQIGSASACQRCAHSNRLRYLKLGNRYLVSETTFQEFISSLECSPSEEELKQRKWYELEGPSDLRIWSQVDKVIRKQKLEQGKRREYVGDEFGQLVRMTAEDATLMPAEVEVLEAGPFYVSMCQQSDKESNRLAAKRKSAAEKSEVRAASVWYCCSERC